jgi:hypothetical protein
VSFSAVTLYVAFQRVFIIVVLYFVIDSVRKLLDTYEYVCPSSQFIHITLIEQALQCDRSRAGNAPSHIYVHVN